MANTNDLFLGLGHLIPIGSSDLKSDDKVPTYARGQLSFIRDAFGARVFRYMRNRTASATAVGELMARTANTTITNITSGTTTSITKTAAGWTVDAFKEDILFFDDVDASAGAAPEGELGVIVSNTATVIQIDGKRPFSAAAAVNDDFIVYSLFQWKDAADGDLGRDVFGICMAIVSTLYYGWLQCYGYCPDAVHTTAAVTAGDPVVAGAAAIAAFGTDGQELWIGWSPLGIKADQVVLTALVFIDVFSPEGPGTAP